MGPLCELACKIGCKVYEIPATAEVNYHPRHKKAYCIYDPLRCLTGYIVISESSITMEYQSDRDEEELSCACTLSLLSWQEEMKAKGFIMLPMIWRCGACVAVTLQSHDSPSAELACGIGGLVQPEFVMDENGYSITFDGNFCMSGMHYTALVRVGETVKVPLMTALQTLLPIGQRLYLKMESQSAGPLQRRVRCVLEPAHAALRVHLFSPGAAPTPGKVYVACKMCKQGSKVSQIGGAEEASLEIREHCNKTIELYSNLLEKGVAPEVARCVLPQGMYTEFIETGSLYAYARLCKLRLDPHAQKEIQVYAEMVSNILSQHFPVSWKALIPDDAA
jgi:hypothetical protein